MAERVRVPPEHAGLRYAPAAEADAEHWDVILGEGKSSIRSSVAELWRYRDLLLLLVRRDFVAFYKQTVLGPVWFFIQPIFTIGIFTFIFGNLAGLSTDGLPQPLFYLTGLICWSYFSDCVTKTTTVFRDNAAIFGKIYFPRMIIPLSLVVSNLARFGAQFLLLLLMMGYYVATSVNVGPTMWIFALPLLLLCVAGQGLGLGLIVSALTTKYRDLAIMQSFGVQLLMYATPVVYPLSSLSRGVGTIVEMNPMTPVVEGFRLGLLGKGTFDLGSLAYAVGATLLILAFGLTAYSRVERTFVDTI